MRPCGKRIAGLPAVVGGSDITCIVGFSHLGKVYIGGDSAGLSGWGLTVRKDPKVFANGPCIMGFTSSFRMGDLLRYSLVVPERHPDEDIDK